VNKNVKSMWVGVLRDPGPLLPGSHWLHRVTDGGVETLTAPGILCALAYADAVCPRSLYTDSADTRTFAYGTRPQIHWLPDEVVEWAELGGHGPKVSGLWIERTFKRTDYDLVNLCRAGASWKELADLIEEQL